MFFYFSKLWFLWLIVLVLSAVLAWWLCRRFRGPRKPVVDQRQVRELTDARAAASKHESRVNELLSLRARDLDEVTSLRSQIGTVDDLRAKVRTLEAAAAVASAAGATALGGENASLRARADQVAALEADVTALRARVAGLEADAGKLGPLQARLTTLEAEAEEAAALRARVDGLQASADQLAPLQARLAELERDAAGAAALQAQLTAAETAGAESRNEVAGLQARLAELEAEAGTARSAQAELAGLRGRLGVAEAALAAATAATAGATETGAGDAPEPLVGEVAVADAIDVSGAAAVLGSKIAVDDLKVVEGIGPKIEELLHADGIRTWRSLAAADPAHLRQVLEAAGPRFQIHDPASWPQQAELLAGAQWAAFKELTDRLAGGRLPPSEETDG